DRLTIDLPSVDLPISRTGVRFFYPPRVQILPEPGVFRVDPGPMVDAYSSPIAAPMAAPVDASSALRPPVGLQGLVDRFKSQGGERRLVGALPVAVDFPNFGPSIFLAAELTAEGRAATLEFRVKRLRN